MPDLVELWRGGSRLVYPLKGEAITIGRQSDCFIHIPDDHAVSRIHAELTPLGSTWTITDRGSRNGTLVNGVVISKPQLLEDGAEISVGETRLYYRRTEDSGVVTARLPRASMASQKQSVDIFLFRQEGEIWSVAFEGTLVRLRDTKGMQDIARLVKTPHREISALDLMQWSALSSPVGKLLADAARRGGGIGALIDPQARQQYKERVIELEADLAEAIDHNDPVRVSELQQERDFLIAELKAAMGLGGRNRTGHDPAERARKAVTWRIRDTLNRIERANLAAGRHLRRSIRTGSFCIYDPIDEVAWVTND